MFEISVVSKKEVQSECWGTCQVARHRPVLCTLAITKPDPSTISATPQQLFRVLDAIVTSREGEKEGS